MRKNLAALLMAGATFNATATDDTIYGTHSVIFQPVQTGGELQGCTLIYRAAQADHTYLKGAPVVVNGNIGIAQFGGNMLLTFKVGIKDLVGNQPYRRPNFAYLQSISKSTAKVKQSANDGDDGYRLFAYSFFDPSVQTLIEEMLDSNKITVAFNRKKSGMDVLVPIDLNVIDATYPGGDKVIRRRSGETMKSFNSCYLALLNQAKTNLNTATTKD